ncbi:MAG TPA: phosphate signaling complex protein PhoU [Candidatus Aquicultor sp.]|jgi:phosphate transport system protein
MLRKTFHDELKDLTADVLAMGRVTRQAIGNAVQVVVDCDIELADEVIAIDDTIDAMNYNIEERCMELIARQAPVAKDLRLCWTTMFIALHLERMGDLAVNLAKGAKRCPKDEFAAPVSQHINEMGRETLILVDMALKAFEEKDLELASKLGGLDDKIDRMYKNIFTRLAKYQDNESVESIGSILLASRYLERIADHCVDIADRIEYLVTGHVPGEL